MTKEEKTMEEQLNEDLLAEQAEAQAGEEAKEAKKNQKRLYIVHTYSGYENKVKVNLEKRINIRIWVTKFSELKYRKKQLSK